MWWLTDVAWIRCAETPFMQYQICLMCCTEIRSTRTNLRVSLTVSCRYSLFTADLHFMHNHSWTWVESIHWFGWIWFNVTAAKTRDVINQHAVSATTYSLHSLWSVYTAGPDNRPLTQPVVCTCDPTCMNSFCNCDSVTFIVGLTATIQFTISAVTLTLESRVISHHCEQ